MKRTLVLFTILWISLFSYNTIQALPTDKPGDYGYVVYNVEYKGFLTPQAAKDMSPSYLLQNKRPINWYIQYLDIKYKKFWYTDGNLFTKWRVLDVDWRHYDYHVVLWPVNGDPNQEWEFKGTGNMLYYTQDGAFEGVIINRRTGKMLEASSALTNKGRYIYANVLWKGSIEQKEYLKNKNFNNITNKSRIWRVWKHYR